MADNAIINATTVLGGVLLRYIQRLTGNPSGAITAVIQIDQGGGAANPENLVTPLNGLTTAQGPRTPVLAAQQSIVAGGTAQILFPATPNGLMIEVQNNFAADQGVAAENLYISDGGTAGAGDGITLEPGGTWWTVAPTTNAVTIFAATTGHKFYATGG